MMFTRVFVLTKLMTLLVLLQFGRYDCAHHDNESLNFFFLNFFLRMLQIHCEYINFQ